MGKFTITPDHIKHNEIPAFTANWRSGIEAPVFGAAYYYHQGSSVIDSILIDGIEWADAKPDQDMFNALMDGAVSAIDDWISKRF
jgi:hypothetical protein